MIGKTRLIQKFIESLLGFIYLPQELHSSNRPRFMNKTNEASSFFNQRKKGDNKGGLILLIKMLQCLHTTTSN
jgi:hypothetical protein